MTIIYQESDGGRKDAGFKGHTGDCVVRAITHATGKPYIEVYNDLTTITNTAKVKFSKEFGREGNTIKRTIKNKTARNGVYPEHAALYLKPLGWEIEKVRGIGNPVPMKLIDFPHKEGAYIVAIKNHYVAVVDGVALDTWDSVSEKIRGRKSDVYYFWKL